MVAVNAYKLCLGMLINVLRNVHHTFQRFRTSTIHFHKSRKFSDTYVQKHINDLCVVSHPSLKNFRLYFFSNTQTNMKFGGSKNKRRPALGFSYMYWSKTVCLNKLLIKTARPNDFNCDNGGTKFASRNYINRGQWEWGYFEEKMQIKPTVSALVIECTFADFYRWISQEQSCWQTAKWSENGRK